MQTFNSLKEDFAFGQYRFQSLETVLAKDPGYVIWLRKTNKIEVNCLYIGASQAELDRCKSIKQVISKPQHVEAKVAIVKESKWHAPDPSFAFTLNYNNSLYLNCPYEDEYTDYEFSRYD